MCLSVFATFLFSSNPHPLSPKSVQEMTLTYVRDDQIQWLNNNAWSFVYRDH